MKTINNENILDRIYDLADGMNMRIDKFMDKLEEDYGEKLPDIENLPQEIAEEITSARETKKEAKKQSRIRKSEEDRIAEIKRFREVFPEVASEDIPSEVWDEVSNGVSLSHAYALYLVEKEGMDNYAREINNRNSQRGAKANSEGATEPSFTKEQVERMSGSDVRSNYKGILKAMKNWKF